MYPTHKQSRVRIRAALVSPAYLSFTSYEESFYDSDTPPIVPGTSLFGSGLTAILSPTSHRAFANMIAERLLYQRLTAGVMFLIVSFILVTAAFTATPVPLFLPGLGLSIGSFVLYNVKGKDNSPSLWLAQTSDTHMKLMGVTEFLPGFVLILCLTK